PVPNMAARIPSTPAPSTPSAARCRIVRNSRSGGFGRGAGFAADPATTGEAVWFVMLPRYDATKSCNTESAGEDASGFPYCALLRADEWRQFDMNPTSRPPVTFTARL